MFETSSLNGIEPIGKARPIAELEREGDLGPERRRDPAGLLRPVREEMPAIARDDPRQRAPPRLVAWLAHESCTEEATVHEGGAGYFARFNWARSTHLYATEKEGVEGLPTPEHVRDGAAAFSDFANGDVPLAGDGTMAGSAVSRVIDHIET